MGRCGTALRAASTGLEPDIVLLGKGFAGRRAADRGGARDRGGRWPTRTCTAAGRSPGRRPPAPARSPGPGHPARRSSLQNVAELEAMAREVLTPLVGATSRWATCAPSARWSASSSSPTSDSIRPAPAFHRAVHQALVRRGMLGMTQWGKWIYRLHPALNMPPELFAWSCGAGVPRRWPRSPPRRRPSSACSTANRGRLLRLPATGSSPAMSGQRRRLRPVVPVARQLAAVDDERLRR